MSVEKNKAMIQNLYEEVNKGNLEALDTLVHSDFVSYGGYAFPVVRGLESLKQIVKSVRAAFPDLHFDVNSLIAEGEYVAARGTVTGTHEGNFMGMAPPTGNKVKWTGIAIFRIENSKIAERWFSDDDLGLMQQLGIIPAQ